MAIVVTDTTLYKGLCDDLYGTEASMFYVECGSSSLSPVRRVANTHTNADSMQSSIVNSQGTSRVISMWFGYQNVALESRLTAVLEWCLSWLQSTHSVRHGALLNVNKVCVCVCVLIDLNNECLNWCPESIF